MARGDAVRLADFLPISCRLLPGVLLFLAFPAAGQQYPFAIPQCLPEQIGGSGKGFLARDFTTGRCSGGWWCQRPDGTWIAYTHCTLNAYRTSAAPVLNAAGAASGASDSLRASITASQRTPKATEVAAYNALHDQMRTALLATKPAAAVWVVDVGTDAAKLTRPAFPFSNGTRGTTSTARATSGQPCKLDVAQSPSASSGTVYAAFGPNFSPSLVALCRKG